MVGVAGSEEDFSHILDMRQFLVPEDIHADSDRPVPLPLQLFNSIFRLESVKSSKGVDEGPCQYLNTVSVVRWDRSMVFSGSSPTKPVKCFKIMGLSAIGYNPLRIQAIPPPNAYMAVITELNTTDALKFLNSIAPVMVFLAWKLPPSKNIIKEKGLIFSILSNITRNLLFQSFLLLSCRIKT